MHMHGQEHAMARVWTSEDIFLKSILFFHGVSPRDSSQFILLGGRHLFPLRHLADLEVKFLVIAIFSLRSPWGGKQIFADSLCSTRTRGHQLAYLQMSLEEGLCYSEEHESKQQSNT